MASPILPRSGRAAAAGVAAALLAFLAGACGKPDARALQKLACEHAAASFDLQSVAQLDALRKALGIAPSVDPIGYCRSLGARMEVAPAAQPQPAEPEGNP